MPGTEMTLSQAQEEFANILARLSPAKVPQFFAWIKDGVGSLNGVKIEEDAVDRQLKMIKKEIRQLVSFLQEKNNAKIVKVEIDTKNDE